MNNFFKFTLVITIILLLLMGCTKENSENPIPGPSQEEPQEQPGSAYDIGEFFPLSKGSYWNYEGKGNEYATFSRLVIFKEGNKAQIRENNGGTVSATVFKSTKDAIIRVFFQGEEYEDKNFLNENEDIDTNITILKAPLQVGNKWTEPNGTREIVEVNATVDTPAEKFKDCIKVKVTYENSIIYEYFKKGVGMVKREFQAEDTIVTSSLVEYSIK